MAEIRNFICAAEECTLCMACFNVCPKGAISVGTDEFGYEQMLVDSERCIDCGLCKTVCQRRANLERNIPIVTYAAQAKSKDALRKSASGGAFQMLAQLVLEKDGVCYGCAFSKQDGGFSARHMRVDSLELLPQILNSKYIPSLIGNAYQQVKQDLASGRLVLFSGTPCQIQGLRAYLNKDYDNLLTADLICHGITSAPLFNRYVESIEKRENKEIVDYTFRDKSVSWGTNYCYSYIRTGDPGKRVHTYHCPREESSYMMHYLRGNIFRENCYQCECANTERFSDFTLGDYWEVEREHPEYILKEKKRMVLRSGISCILANTEKGNGFAKLLEDRMILHEVELNSVVDHNSNLKAPSNRGRKRDWFLTTFREAGYGAIEDAYRQEVGSKMRQYRLKNFLKSYLPDVIRIWIYNSPILSRMVFHQ